jgi:hypothetical protein
MIPSGSYANVPRRTSGSHSFLLRAFGSETCNWPPGFSSEASCRVEHVVGQDRVEALARPGEVLRDGARGHLVVALARFSRELRIELDSRHVRGSSRAQRVGVRPAGAAHIEDAPERLAQ